MIVSLDISQKKKVCEILTRGLWWARFRLRGGSATSCHPLATWLGCWKVVMVRKLFVLVRKNLLKKRRPLKKHQMVYNLPVFGELRLDTLWRLSAKTESRTLCQWIRMRNMILWTLKRRIGVFLFHAWSFLWLPVALKDIYLFLLKINKKCSVLYILLIQMNLLTLFAKTLSSNWTN